MNPDDYRRPTTGPFGIDLTMEEVLEDLCWPAPPPGRWQGPPAAIDRTATEDVDYVLGRLERAA